MVDRVGSSPIDVAVEWQQTGWERAFPTLPELLRRWEQVAPDRVALRVKDRGRWAEITYAEWASRSRRFGAGLAELGVRSGDRIAILSENRPEWLIACTAAQGLRAIPYGVYPTSPSTELAYLLDDADAAALVVEDQEQLDKAIPLLDDRPGLTVVVLERRGNEATIAGDPRILHFDDVVEVGAEALLRRPELWDSAGNGTQPDEIATIIYTSGTTGPPKGAMLSWRNVNEQIALLSHVLEMKAGDEALSYLPLCHVAELNMSYFGALGCGVTVSFAESVETVQADLRAVRPTLFFAVPRISEKLVSSIEDRVADATPLKRAAHRAAMRIGHWLLERRLAREPNRPAWYEQPAHALAWLLAFRSLRKHLGTSRVRVAISGGAPVSREVLHYLLVIGVPVLEAYGMTEASGMVALNTHEDVGLGTVGRVVLGTELRLADDGEILLRGGTVFAGYWDRPDATAETIDAEGWLHTGDVGELDDAGRLRLTDRKKDIIITAGGKNLSPSEIENAVKASPYVKEAVVIGDGRRFITALIQIEHETVANWAKRQGVPFTTFRDLTEKPEVHTLIEGAIEDANDRLARVEQIKRFRLLPRELNQDDDEITATQKVRRKVVAERYAELIEEMYT